MKRNKGMTLVDLLIGLAVVGIIVVIVAAAIGCDGVTDSDVTQSRQHEALLKEATAQTGMPAIKNFRERKLLKDILELRDQDCLVTYTYTYSEMTGDLIYLGESIGYGIPASTQYTNPMKSEYYRNGGSHAIPQADPNGLFSPASSDATWVMLKNPATGDVKPVYVEPRIVVSPFKLK